MTPARKLLGSWALLLVGGCGLLTEPVSGDVADIRGTWALTGTQASPSTQLVGTLAISTQQGADVAGTALWEETDGGGFSRLDGGAVSGRVLGQEDVDLDISSVDGERRFIGRIASDTISGSWVQPSAGRSGSFRAVRESRP